MLTRQLGTRGPYLTEIGLGAWAIGGAWKYGWGNSDDEESLCTIHRSLDLGINWIDTAAVYGLGHSEEVVGKALTGRRDRVFLATKCGMVWDDEKHVAIHLGPKSIRREIEESLRRLHVDYVDLYQFHWPDPSTPVEESWNEMMKIQDEGKARFIGVCNFGVDLLQRCEKLRHVQSLQPIYNMVERGIEQEVLPYCAAQGIGAVVYSPMQSGLLTGKFNKNTMAADDWRQENERFTGEQLKRAERIVAELRPIAARYGKTIGQTAVAWTLRLTSVTSAIVGARKVKHAEENIGGADWTLADADLQAIERILSH